VTLDIYSYVALGMQEAAAKKLEDLLIDISQNNELLRN
jgi:hypothetical protein